MAFFDDDPPTQQQRAPAPRRLLPARRARRVVEVDPQQIWARRLVAIGGIVLVLFVIALGLNGCVTSAKKNALTDYGQAVTDIGTESSSNVGQGLQLLASRTSARHSRSATRSTSSPATPARSPRRRAT